MIFLSTATYIHVLAFLMPLQYVSSVKFCHFFKINSNSDSTRQVLLKVINDLVLELNNQDKVKENSFIHKGWYLRGSKV